MLCDYGGTSSLWWTEASPGHVLRAPHEGGRKEESKQPPTESSSANRPFALGNQLLFACFLGIAM